MTPTQSAIAALRSEHPHFALRARMRYLDVAIPRLTVKKVVRDKNYPITNLCIAVDEAVEDISFSMLLRDWAVRNCNLQWIVISRTYIEEKLKILTKLEKRIHYAIKRMEGEVKEGEITEEMKRRAREYPIQDLMEFNNRNFAKCLWHEEKTGSLHLTPFNTVHCFGCGVTKDAIDVKMKLEGLTFVEAVRALQ